MSNDQSLTSDEDDLKSVVEAAFGAGAFDLLAADETPVPDAGHECTFPDNESPCRDTTNAVGGVSFEQFLSDNPSTDAAATCAAVDVVVFEIAGSLYSVPIDVVSEIQREQPTTPIPHVPPWIRGVTNLRGAIVSVIDVGTRLGLAEVGHPSGRHMIIVRLPANDCPTALLVGQVIGIRTLAESPQIPHTHAEGVAASFVQDWKAFDSVPVAVLDVDRTAFLE